MPASHNILLLAFPNGQLLDIAGPLQMFAGANDELSRRAYRIEIAAPQAGPFATSSGVRLVADMAFTQVTTWRAPIPSSRSAVSPACAKNLRADQ
jgi:transcriptional regulator GlxA family with amidase domain